MTPSAQIAGGRRVRRWCTRGGAPARRALSALDAALTALASAAVRWRDG